MSSAFFGPRHLTYDTDRFCEFYFSKLILNEMFIDGAANLLIKKFQSRYHGKVDHTVKDSHILFVYNGHC